MPTEHVCESYARTAQELAALTPDRRLRDLLLDLAREWMAEAMGEQPRLTADKGNSQL
jgi:hypothetical protein